MFVIEAKKKGAWTRDVKLLPRTEHREHANRESAEAMLERVRRASRQLGACDTCLCYIEDFRIVEVAG